MDLIQIFIQVHVSVLGLFLFQQWGFNAIESFEFFLWRNSMSDWNYCAISRRAELQVGPGFSDWVRFGLKFVNMFRACIQIYRETTYAFVASYCWNNPVD